MYIFKITFELISIVLFSELIELYAEDIKL